MTECTGDNYGGCPVHPEVDISHIDPPRITAASANPYACICGYPGTSQRDLDGHLIAASPLDPEGTHRPANR